MQKGEGARVRQIERKIARREEMGTDGENEEKVMQLGKELEEEKEKSRQLQEEVRAAQDAVLPVIPSAMDPLAEVRYAYDCAQYTSTVSQYYHKRTPMFPRTCLFNQ